MPLVDRQAVMRRIERLRGGRKLVAICNFDRPSDPHQLPGLSTQFQDDMKEPLFRVLKETVRGKSGLDILLYTRGGATNAVWPIVSLIREFDSDFEVLIPFRAHSSGTILTLAARKIVMTQISELSPIDPTTANQYNPRDGHNPQALLGIAVEDVTAFQEFWKGVLSSSEMQVDENSRFSAFNAHVGRLSESIHPLALGNVHRIYTQIRALARMLLAYHGEYSDEDIARITDTLTKGYYSHSHMINRHEARGILGDGRVVFADTKLSKELDDLLRGYETDFALRHQFFLGRYMGDNVERDARFIGGAVESTKWGYLNETSIKIRQYLAPPQGIQIQVPPGSVAPLVPGLPRKFEWQSIDQGWRRNEQPRGVTLC